MALTFFVVGHSHGLRDQKFGEVRHRLFSENVLESPSDFMKAISNVRPAGNRSQRIERLESVFDFNAFFDGLKISVSGHTSTRGKLCQGQYPAHVFHLISRVQLRQYLEGADLPELVNSFSGPPSPGDILLLCKAYLADTSYAQAMVLCPEANLDELCRQGMPQGISGRKVYVQMPSGPSRP